MKGASDENGEDENQRELKMADEFIEKYNERKSQVGCGLVGRRRRMERGGERKLSRRES